MTEEIISTVTPTALPKSTTADDLLKMYDEEPVNEQTEIKQEATKQARIKEEIPKIEAANKFAKALSDSPDEKLNLDREGDEETATESDVKAIKAKFGDKDIDVPEDAVLKHSINGKDVEFKAKDAIQAYVKQEEFNRNMDRRVGTVVQREKNFQGEFARVQERAKRVWSYIEAGDILGTVRELGALGSKDNLERADLERKFLEAAEKFPPVLAKLTPEQKESFYTARKAKLLEEHLKERNTKDAQTGAEAQLLSKISGLREQASVPEDEFWTTYKGLADELVGEGKVWKTPNDIAPEDVINQVLLTRHVEKVYQAAKKVGLEDEAVLDEVIRQTQDQNWSTDDIAQVIKDSGVLVNAPKKSVENLNRKAERGNLKAQFQSKASSNQKKTKDWLDKEIEEDLYRHEPKKYKSIHYGR